MIELVSAVKLQHSYSEGIRGRSYECSCLSVMLRQDELAFINAISTPQLSHNLLKVLSSSVSRREKKTAMPAGGRNTYV